MGNESQSQAGLGILTWHVAERFKHILFLTGYQSRAILAILGSCKISHLNGEYISHTASSPSSSLSSFWPPSINHVIRGMTHSHKRIQSQNSKIDTNPTGSSHGEQFEPKQLKLLLIYPSNSQGLGSIWAIKTAYTLEYLHFTVSICVFLHNSLSFY